MFRRKRTTPTYAQRAAEPYRAPQPRAASETPLFDQLADERGIRPARPDFTDALTDALLANGILTDCRQGVAA